MTVRKWIPLLVVVLAFGASAAVYSDLPNRVPSHWNLSGEVDGWMSREWGAFIMPLILAGLMAMLRILPAIDPKGANYAKFRGTYESLIIASMLFILALHAVMLAIALGYDISMNRVVPAGIGLLLIVLGNLLPRTRANWFVGIRTPWTLSSDRVWERTHRFGGRLLVAGGAVVVLAAMLFPRLSPMFMLAVVLGVTAAVLAYSYAVWRRERVAGDGVAGAGAPRR